MSSLKSCLTVDYIERGLVVYQPGIMIFCLKTYRDLFHKSHTCECTYVFPMMQFFVRPVHMAKVCIHP